jgi:2-dehydro-3-deoxygalactonokinase
LAGGTQWVAVDWGTSNVRAWGIAADGSQSFAVGSDKGMGKLARADFPSVLNELIGPQVEGPVEIVICGMAGARQGWLEAPYLETPASLHDLLSRSVRPEGADPRFTPRILPGICQRQPGHEDVMRGEETQLLGLLHLKPGFSGTAILPGTHSKWAEIRDGKLLRFSSAMTGEFYEVLSQHSVLRHSFAGDTNGPATEDGVAEGLAAGLAHPELLTALAFRTRAAALLSGKGPDWCSGYLSGLLVGTEIGGHRDWLAPGQSVPLIGSARFARLYGAALKQIGIDSFALDAAEATIAGLKEARAQ